MRASGPAQVVLLHPSGGELFCYMPLARALREDIGVAGFAADPRDAAVAPQDGMVATATRIARSLTASGLPESCCLVGWSYGGVLAFEVARQIEQETGHGCRRSCWTPHTTRTPCRSTSRRSAAVRARRRQADGTRPPGGARGAGRPGRRGGRRQGDADGLGIELDLTEEELAARFEIFRFCARSMQAYRPPAAYGGPVTVLTASPQLAMEEQWRKACTGPLKAESVPADHYTLFAEPALSRVVAAIDEMLAS